MPTELIGAASAIVQLGAAGILALGVLGFFTGAIRVGKLVDAEAIREAAARDKREGQLAAERDAWMGRALAGDARTDRLADAFETALKIQAPK